MAIRFYLKLEECGLPLLMAPKDSPFSSMNAPSITIWMDKGSTTVAVEVEYYYILYYVQVII